MKAHKFPNPFPGLRPFETDENHLFFGREGQSDELLARLQRTRFLAVVGTSGSGKSSLVRAGLLPALYGGMMAGTGSGWRIAVMRPGHSPLGNLACALSERGVLTEAAGGLRGAEGVAVIEATLRRGSLGLVDAVRQARLEEHENLLVVVDQFEELFRFRAASALTGVEDEASAFIKLLLEASAQRDAPIYVVLTMRSDFLGDCAQFQGLPEAINDGQYLIPRLTRDDRRQAITGPVAVARGRMTEPLVNRLLNDVGDNPDQLPILQHALMRTWDHWIGVRRDGEPLGVEHYEAIGTMSDALSRHADEAWDELPDDRSRHLAELLFKALTERGADNREIRRPTRLKEICDITGASAEEVAAVVEIFRREGRSFLMPPAGVALTPETIIDISHESLIRNWERLKAWVKDEAEAARIYRRLAGAATDYREGAGGLLDDVTLQYVLKWRDKYNPNRAWGVRYHPDFDAAIAYLEESREAREARERDARERDARELERARAFAEQQRKAAQRLRWLLGGMAVMFVLALATAGYAMVARLTARAAWQVAVESERAAKAAQAEAVESAKTAKKAQADAEQSAREVAEGAERLRKEKEKSDQMASNLIEEKKKTDEALVAERAAVASQQKALEAQKLATDLARRQTLAAQENLVRFQLSLRRSSANVLGRAAFQRDDYTNALEMFREALDILKEEQLRPANDQTRIVLTLSQIALLTNLGATQRKLGEFDAVKFDDAVKSYEDAASIMSKIIAEAGRADNMLGGNDGSDWRLNEDGEWTLFDIYHGLAHSYRDRATHIAEGYDSRSGGDTPEVKEKKVKEGYDKAEEYFNKALVIQEKLLKGADPSRLASSSENLARLYRDLGKYEEAEPVYMKILELREKLPDKDEYIATLKEFAQFYVSQNRYADAAEQHDKVLAVQEKELVDGDLETSDLRDLADSYSDLGEVYIGLNDELSARNKKDEAKAYELKARYSFQLARSMQSYAIKLRQLDRLSKATDRPEGEKLEKLKALKIEEELHELADLFVRVGRFQPAASLYTSLLLVLSQTGNVSAQAEACIGLANLYRFHLKNYAGAEEYYKLASSLLPDTSDTSLLRSEALTQLGSLYMEELNKPTEAEKLLKDALAYEDKTSGSERAKYLTLSVLAGVYRRQNKADDFARVSREKLKVAAELLRLTSGNTVQQKAWDASAYAEAFGLYIDAVAGLSEAFKMQGNAEAARSVYGALLEEELDVNRVLDENVLDAYAKMLETHGDYLKGMIRPPSAHGNVAERIKSAREKQTQIEQITRQQQIRQQAQQGYAPTKPPE
jgi:tetratricopeptide (TPR) repeat protein